VTLGAGGPALHWPGYREPHPAAGRCRVILGRLRATLPKLRTRLAEMQKAEPRALGGRVRRSEAAPRRLGADGLSLSDVRARIKKLQAQVEALKRVPVPASDIERKVRNYVEGLPMPSITGIAAGQALTVQWPTGLHALLAFVKPEVLAERTMAGNRSDREYAVSPGPAPAADRQI
jgi:hypothetical protein